MPDRYEGGFMPNIFDNITDETRIGPALRDALLDFETVDIATGYLDLRGWSVLADIVESRQRQAIPESSAAKVVRVLVGMVAPSDSQAILDSLQDEVQPPTFGSDIHDLEKARDRRDQLVKHLRNQLMRGIATSAGQTTLQMLKSQLTSGAVEMKVFTEKPLHGKTYIFHAPSKKHGSRWAYVGSSNLTGAGLYSNLELNIDVQDSDATAKLADWFNDRWDDPFSLVITAEIIQLISQSWADEEQPTPFEVYLKVCHALSQDARDGMGYVLPASMRTLLLDYQESAVRTLARRLVRRGGTMLGDVVGLGKTLTAVATALMLQAAEDYTTLVLCPKNVEEMWVDHLDEYDVNGRVVPYSMVSKVLPDLKRFNLVICDESHNLRNSGTIAYEAIHDYIRTNGSKVLLLTATPYNLAFEDVANQIGLYLDDDDDLGIVPTAAIQADPSLINKVDGKISSLSAFRRSELAEDWRRLMSDHLVRRTRSFIKRSAKAETIELPDGTHEIREYLQFANGEKFHFPDRISRPLSHAFTDDDPARLMEDDTTLDAIQALRLARYRLADYDDPRADHTELDSRNLTDIRTGRGNVSGFVRIGLFKRLSSSGHSFIVSLRRQRARNELFVYAIQNRLPVPLGSFSDNQISFTDVDPEDDSPPVGSVEERYNDLRMHLPEATKWINTGVFSEALLEDLEHDNAILTGLLERFGQWVTSRDSKIKALVNLLSEEHPDEKVLIFTEYADTATYVAEALENFGVDRVGLVTGDIDNPSAIVRSFSPHSHLLPGKDRPEGQALESPIDVLVATDVLSEGQNLQDCHIIVNYDLPWAIIRIIQRAGRVDRIGQKSKAVFVYLLSHEKVEQQINLRRRIKARLGASAAAFGSDEQFFGSEQEVNIIEDLYHGRLSDDAEDSEGEADAVSEAWLVWSTAQEEFPAVASRALALQDMVHTTRSQYLHEPSSGVACFISTASGVDAFAYSSDGEVGQTDELLTPLEALRVFRAEVDTPTLEMRPDHFERERALVLGSLAAEVVAQGNLRGIRKWAWERLGGNTLFAAAASDALNALHERPLTSQATRRLQIARRNRYSLEDLADLLNQLHDEDRLVISSGDTDPIKVVCSVGVQHK
jgi:superfamily II DNA or RNA helicase